MSTPVKPPFLSTVPIPPSRYTSSHLQSSLAGPGDSRPTALDIIRDEDLLAPALAGKVFLVTGCSSGIGVETARALHATGAEVWITVRDVAQGERLAKDILSDGGEGKVEVLQVELDRFASVREAAQDFKERQEEVKGKGGARLDILVCNAGVMACPFSLTPDGHERQFATNHLGHFLLFSLLRLLLLSSSTPTSPSRVIMVSSSGHHNHGINFSDYTMRHVATFPPTSTTSLPTTYPPLGPSDSGAYNPWLAYGQSKTANIYMANSITRHYGSSPTHPIHGLSLMPGGIETPLQKYQPHLIPDAKANPEALKTMKSVGQGAATTVLAAVGKEWRGVGGVYLEDCAAAEEGAVGTWKGYVGHAFDEEKEERLWRESCGMVGVEVE